MQNDSYNRVSDNTFSTAGEALPESKSNFGNLVDLSGAESSSKGTAFRQVSDQFAVEEYEFPHIEIDHKTSPEETSEQRSLRFAQRFKEVTGRNSEHEAGPEAELNAWADSWKDFIEVIELPEGAFQKLAQDFGSQMILGQFDQEQLSGHLKGINKSPELETLLQDFRDELKTYGVEAKLTFDEGGQATGFELGTISKEGEAKARLRIDSSGKLTGTGFDAEGKPLTEEEVVKQIAKKASPLACP